MTINYLSGLGNHHQSEALEGALPQGQNSPLETPYGLYAEQLSGTAFTKRPRHSNLRSWVYRIYPACVHAPFARMRDQFLAEEFEFTPNQLRFKPLEIPKLSVDWLASLRPIAESGNLTLQAGGRTYLYACNQSMTGAFYNSDGEFLIVPEHGALKIVTELGPLEVAPLEIAVIPCGIRFQVFVDKEARGYVLENYGQPLSIPELGPIGANGLANARDFKIPTAQFIDMADQYQLIAKFQGELFETELNHYPFDVVAWHGNYYPYKYDLRQFNTINSVSFDHPDPSIFTVLTSPTEVDGVANIDFVIFPPRWMVAEHTFRPPYYHRNIMNEMMGLIQGVYDAKGEEFAPGGLSVHNRMSGHGPDAESFLQAHRLPEKPIKVDATMAFMFESRDIWAISKKALNSKELDRNYHQHWLHLPKNFSGNLHGNRSFLKKFTTR